MDKIRRFHLILVLTLVLSFFLPSISAFEDSLRFVDATKEEPEEVEYVFIGQYSSLTLEVKIGYNVSSWSLEVENNSLLLNFFNERYNEIIEATYWGFQDYNIDPEAEIGIHDLIFHLNYTKTSGDDVHKQFHLRVELIKPWEITKLELPKGSERDFTISVRTYISISNLTVNFGGDGDVEVEDESISLSQISPGNYTYQTRIRHGDFDAIDGQELSYHIIGQADNRTFELMEYNIPADIDWTMSETKDSFTDWLIIIINAEFLLGNDGGNELNWYMVIFWILTIIIIIGSITLIILKVKGRTLKKSS